MLRFVVAVLLGAAVSSAATPDVINGHPVVLDRDGRLLSWVRPQERAYDRVMRLAWDFLLQRVPLETNGLPTFYAYCCIDPRTMHGTAWPHNPAGLYAMFVDSAVAYYAYSGDRLVLDLVGGVLDHQLASGTTPSDWTWAAVPYASSDHGATRYRGAFEFQYDRKQVGRGDGYGVIEPDKVGELGFAYLKFWKQSGEARYRDAALACANAMAKHVRAGNAEQSPWPFRVYAETAFVREQYSANAIGGLKLFDELIRLGLGDTAGYRSARATAWSWLLRFPMTNNVWANYFEDIPYSPTPDNLNQYSPLETARYLMERPDLDPEWRAHAAGLIAFVEKTFGLDTKRESGNQFGAITISEQSQYDYKMVSHTSRYASVLARWAELAGDAPAREKAFRSLNWATYMCDDKGLVRVGPKERSVWFSDGYGDFIRHVLAAIGAQPEWAPPGENHLVRSTSVVQAIEYRPDRVSYRTFDPEGEEVLRLAFAPKAVTANGKPLTGWTFDRKTAVLRLRRAGAKQVEIQ